MPNNYRVLLFETLLSRNESLPRRSCPSRATYSRVVAKLRGWPASYEDERIVFCLMQLCGGGLSGNGGGSALNSTSGTRCGRQINIIIPDSCDRWHFRVIFALPSDKSASAGFPFRAPDVVC